MARRGGHSRNVAHRSLTLCVALLCTLLASGRARQVTVGLADPSEVGDAAGEEGNATTVFLRGFEGAGCSSGYAAPRGLGRIWTFVSDGKEEYRQFGRIDGPLNEESGIASSRKNPKVLWIHNDSGDEKIYAVSVHPDSFGRVIAIVNLQQLPGINRPRYSDFEDIAVAQCPFQTDLRPEGREWCIWVGDVGDNSERRKGTSVYAFPEPTFPVDHNIITTETYRPDTATVFALTHDTYFTPNVEAMVVANDGSKFWLIQKAYKGDGDGPAGIYESPLLVDLSTRSKLGGTDLMRVRVPERVRPLAMKRVKDIRNPLPECATCEDSEHEREKYRVITAADLSIDGTRLLLGTYGGIFEYQVDPAFDLTSVSEGRQLTNTHYNGRPLTERGKLWLGQEGACYDYTGSQEGQDNVGIWSVSEHHRKLYYLSCNDP